MRFSRTHLIIGFALAFLGSPRQGSAQEYIVPGLGNTTGSNLTVAEAREYVRLHDVARAAVGIKVRLEWSAEIAAWAQKWADDRAANGLTRHRPDNKYGENMFYGSGDSWTPADAVRLWESEKAKYNGEAITATNYLLFGHYTQMVWQKTVKVGAGKAFDKINNRTIVVGNYDPFGNFVGEKPYEGGPPVVIDPVKPIEPKKTVEPVNPRPAPQPVINIGRFAIAKGTKFSNELTEKSQFIEKLNKYCRVYDLQLKKGDMVTIDLESTDFDTFLVINNANDQPIAFNDDIAPGNTNSRVVLTAKYDGMHYVIVSSYKVRATGKYLLSVR